MGIITDKLKERTAIKKMILIILIVHKEYCQKNFDISKNLPF